MDEQSAFNLAAESYTGALPVFTTGYYTLHILSAVDDVADDFLGRYPVEDMSEDEVRRAFERYQEEEVFTTFASARASDPDCLFPWTTQPNCRFEEPYAILNSDGSMNVFQDMNEWLAFLDDDPAAAACCDTFAEYARTLGVRLLCDW